MINIDKCSSIKFKSVSFSYPNDKLILDNLNLDIIDEGIYVSDKDAFARVDELLRKEGILAGTSCGTLVDAAIKWCQKQTETKKVVTLICDTGNKYLSKAFNKDWLKENELID